MRWLFSHVVVSAVLTFSAAGVAAATFEITSHTAVVDPAQRAVRFSIEFNQPPDFFMVDEFDRPASAFQYWYDAEPGGFEFAGEDVVVIRGPEIRFGGMLPVRASLNKSGEEFPGAEGWGEKLGEVPFDIDGSIFAFTAPWNVLGETDDQFTYRLSAFEFGTQTTEVSAVFIDLPAPLKLGAVALAITMIGLGIQRRSAR